MAADGVEGSLAVTVSAADGFEFFRIVNAQLEPTGLGSRNGDGPALASQPTPPPTLDLDHVDPAMSPNGEPEEAKTPADSDASGPFLIASLQGLLDRLIGSRAATEPEPENWDEFDAAIEAVLAQQNHSGELEDLDVPDLGSHQEKSEGVVLAMGLGLFSAWFARRRAQGRRLGHRSNASTNRPGSWSRRFFPSRAK